MKSKYFLLILIIVSIFSSTLLAQDTNIIQTKEDKINVYFFGTSTCPYCADEKEFFTNYVKENPDVRVHYFELDTQRQNAKLLMEFSEAFDERSTSVPITFISEKVWIGFSDSIKTQMETVINSCRENKCKDSFDYIENKEDLEYFLIDDKYVDYLGEENTNTKERISFFKKIANFFKNLF
jgi:glutaredoxin